MTFAIGSAAEAFSVLVVAPSVDRVGRHNIVALGNMLGGAACLACANAPGGYTQAALSAVGKFGCSGVYCDCDAANCSTALVTSMLPRGVQIYN